MDVQTILEDIGLTRNEIKVYLALLSLGSTTSGPLIKQTGLHTSKVYDSLERLSEKGIVSHYLEDNSKHFKAVDPVRLKDFLAEKKKKITQQEAEIMKIIPFLQKRQRVENDDTEVEIFRGWKGMDTVYTLLRNTLKKGETNYVFGASNGEEPAEVMRFFDEHNVKVAQKGIRYKIVCNESTRGAIGELGKYPRLFQVRYIEHTTPAEISIWKDRVMITILSKKPTIILMRDKNLIKAFLEYFNVMWALAKP